MFKIDAITKDWKEAGAFMAQVNLYGFWDEHCFLTKSGDLGCALRIGGIDAEGLDHAGRDYVVKRLEAAFRSLDEKARLYQVLFRHNRPEMRRAEYENPLVHAAVEQRADFLAAKADRLYSVEIFWIVMVDGSYAKPDCCMRCRSCRNRHARPCGTCAGCFQAARNARCSMSRSSATGCVYSRRSKV